MKEVKLNFKFDERTTNNRIYSARNVATVASKRIRDNLFFLEYNTKYEDNEVDLKKIIGIVVGYKLKQNQMTFYVNPLTNEDEKLLNVIDECTIGASGIVNAKNNRVLVKQIICIRPTPEYIFDKSLFDEDTKEVKNRVEEETASAKF